MSDTHTLCGIVRHHQCDANGYAKLAALLDYLQDAAAEHAGLLGFGMEEMRKNGLIWVLSRLKFTMSSPLKLGEKWEVLTYPSGLEKIFARRQYRITSGGRTILTAGSDWLILRAGSGRPLNPAKALPTAMPENPDREIFFPSLEKLPPCGGNRHGLFRVGMGDVDLNRHLNNAVYGRWITDFLGEERPGTVPWIRSMQIN